MIKLVFAILVQVLILLPLANAQQLPIRHFTSDEGLAQNDVLTAYQDSQGYLWFGTYSGLSRFDGKHFVSYNEEKNGLGGSIVRKILEDAQKNLWVGFTGGFAQLIDNKFVNYTMKEGLLSDHVLGIWAESDGGMWIFTSGGVSYFKNGKFENYPLKTEEIGTLQFNFISGTRTGDVFIANDQGLQKFNSKSKQFEQLSTINFPVVDFKYSSQDNAIYIIDQQNLYRLKDGKLETLAKSPLEGKLHRLAFGANETIWLYSESEVWKWSPGRQEVYSNAELQESSISSVLEDREGNLWLTRWGGVSMVVNSKIANYKRGLPGKTATFIQKDDSGDLWVSGEQGIVKMNQSGEILLRIKSAYVNSFLVDQDSIFSGTDDGLIQYDLSGKIIKETDHTMFSFLKDSKNRIWIGGENGLFLWNQGALELKMNTQSGLKSNHVWEIFEDKKGAIWIGTDNGVSRLVDGKVSYFGKEQGLSHNSVWDIIEHPTWGLLIATEKGISVWKGDKFETAPFLEDETINFLVVDKKGNLWVGTDGLYRINNQKQIDLFLNKPRGLPSQSTYSNSVFIDERYLYAGTYGGLSRIELAIKNDKSIEPLLEINQIEINHQPEDNSVLIQPLKHDQNNFVFHFNSIYMYLPNTIKFKYLLEGMEQEWSKPTSIQQAVYTNIPHGHYTFKVQALAEMEKKSEVQSISFIIEPPFWLTWWAYALYGLIAIGLILVITISQTRRVRRKADRELQVKQQFFDAANRFVPSEFLDHLNREDLIAVNLGDCVQANMSILFSDLRSFTTISEGMTPEENFNFLNNYLGKMTPSILKNAGFIDKFIGDAIMALFPKSPDDAIAAGIEMLQELNRMNEERKRNNLFSIHMGIGVHQGSMMLGTIGGKERMETTVISDAVNLAARLEGMTKIYGVSLLITDELHQNLNHPDQIATRIIDRVQAKGKTEPVTIYEVYSGDPQEILEKKVATSRHFQEGIALCHLKEFKEAKQLFEKCLSVFPEDKATVIYIKRCTHYLKVGWDEDWDGITQLDTK